MYRLYIDEMGTDCLLHLDKDKHRYLSLTGVAIELNHVARHLEPMMNSIKTDLFKHDPDDPIVFHRRDILGGKGPFEKIRTDSIFEQNFNSRILKLFADTDYTVITALIDKMWMSKQSHWQKTHPYHYLMEILVEKYAQFLERREEIGDIMPESRQNPKDSHLQEAFMITKQNGTNYIDRQRIGAVIRANNLKFRTKRDKVSGLEFCDLIAHPSHMYIRTIMGHDINLSNFSASISNILVKHKYDRSPWNNQIIGYGIKHLP